MKHREAEGRIVWKMKSQNSKKEIAVLSTE